MANDKEDETDNSVPKESVSEEETKKPVSDEDGIVDDPNGKETTDSVSDSDSTVEDDGPDEEGEQEAANLSDEESAESGDTSLESELEDDAETSLASDASEDDLTSEEKDAVAAVSDADTEVQDQNSDRIEIEGGGSISDGTVSLRINGVDVGPLTHIKQILESTSQQIDNARKLFYVTSGITAFVLVISILFYIVLSMQLSQKTDELDRVIMAVAKRGMQLGDGIEKLVGVQDQLLSMEGQQSLIISDLEVLKSNTQLHSRDISGLGTAIGSEIQVKGDEILKLSEAQKEIVLGELKTLGKMKNQLALLTQVENNQKAIRKSMAEDRSVASDIQQKVSDLYIIRKAELTETYKLTENYNK
jgi:cell division protein FtsL